MGETSFGTGSRKEASVSYKCPNCDAGLIFSPEKQTFACEFCLSEFTEEELGKTDSAKRAEEAAKENAAFAGEMRAYSCPSCGAEVLVDASTAADFCYYCHNPVVLSDKVSGILKPDKIIPFQFDKNEAKARFLRFAKKKFFAPKDYASEAQADKVSGVYYPFWVTDADTDATLEAIGHRSRSWRSGNYVYTEVTTFRLHRRGNIHFEDVVNAAIKDADRSMLEGVLPYPPEVHQPFAMPYLLGFRAKKRDIDREELTDTVRNTMSNYAETILKKTCRGFSGLRVDETDLRILKAKWEYTLMPLWILTYPYRGKTYTYAINGYTGKVYGELPVHYGKLFGVFGAVAAALTGLLALLIGGVIW